MKSLSENQVSQFINEGFVKLENAFPAELASECRAILWEATWCNPNNPDTWTKPVIRIGDIGHEPFRKAANTTLLHNAFDQLVGKGNWIPRTTIGSFPIRFPAKVEATDTGWHVDARMRQCPTSMCRGSHRRTVLLLNRPKGPPVRSAIAPTACCSNVARRRPAFNQWTHHAPPAARQAARLPHAKPAGARTGKGRAVQGRSAGQGPDALRGLDAEGHRGRFLAFVTPGLSRGPPGGKPGKRSSCYCANLHSGCRDKPGMTAKPDRA